MVVAALLHDIGDTLAPRSHSEMAAAILRPYVSEKTYWIIKYHGLFQMYYYAHHVGGDRNARDRFLGIRGTKTLFVSVKNMIRTVLIRSTQASRCRLSEASCRVEAKAEGATTAVGSRPTPTLPTLRGVFGSRSG